MDRPGRIRRFIERLPKPPDWAPVVAAIVAETGNYRTFIQECLGNTQNLTQSSQACVLARHRRQGGARRLAETVTARSLAWERWAQIHRWLIMGFYVHILIKYQLIEMISRDSPLGDIRPLDCLIVGRFRFVGRTNMIGDRIATVFFLWFLIYRLYIELLLPKFKFFALEFLMTDHREITRNELRTNEIGTLIFDQQEEERAPSGGWEFAGRLGRAVGPKRRALDASRLDVNSVSYLLSPFHRHHARWILRPNRTSANWSALNFYTRCLFYWTCLTFVGVFFLTSWTASGPIFTNLGFELAYPSCVSWLRDIQATPGRPNNYSHVYLAPRVLAREMPVEDIPARIPLDERDLQAASPYNLIRMSCDLAVNGLIYLELVALFTGVFCMLVIQSLDVSMNALCIQTRLRRLLEKLEARREANLEHEEKIEVYSRLMDTKDNFHEFQQTEVSRQVIGPTKGRGVSYWDSKNRAGHFNLSSLSGGTRTCRAEVDELREEISNMQAILADHFDHITHGYNLYISFLVCCMGLCWFHYTLILCQWVNDFRNRLVELEFILAESSVTLFCLILMSGAALVRSHNMRLYPLVARAMALDADWSTTKPRWATIIKYYHPRPFFCFTVFGNTEISWLFCLKLLSWILSAFTVLANFYFINRA